MRPRVFPAEDVAHHARSAPQEGCASMRPRVFPAEDCNYAAGDLRIRKMLQ